MLPTKRLTLVLLVVVGCLAISPGRAWACSCVPPGTPVEEPAKSTAVFAGKVIDLDVPSGAVISSADPVRVTFRVYTVWKGPAHGTLTITTARSSASCGYAFDRGREYLVHAYGTETELEVGLCSRTRFLSAAGKDLAALGDGTTLTAVGLDSSTSASFLGPLVTLVIGIGIQVLIAAIVIALAQRTEHFVFRILLWGLVLYLLTGLVFTVGGLYCYNVRNWEFHGGLSVPPLYFPIGIFTDLLMWPVYVWANLINGFGVFGNCRPL